MEGKEKKGKNNGRNNGDKKDTKLIIGLTIILIILIIATLLGIWFMKGKQEKDENTLAYTDLIKEIDAQNVEKVEMTVGSTTVKVKMKDQEEEKTAIVPNTEAFVNLIQTESLDGNEIELIQKSRSVLVQIPSIIVSLLPTLIMVALFVMIFKLQGLGEKGKVYEETERKTKVTFKDVAGL